MLQEVRSNPLGIWILSREISLLRNGRENYFLCYMLTHGRRLFTRGGMNFANIVIPPEIALREGILFAVLGEG